MVIYMTMDTSLSVCVAELIPSPRHKNFLPKPLKYRTRKLVYLVSEYRASLYRGNPEIECGAIIIKKGALFSS